MSHAGRLLLKCVVFSIGFACSERSFAEFEVNLLVNGNFEEFDVFAPSALLPASYAKLATGDPVDLIGWDEHGILSLGLYNGGFLFRNPPLGSGDYVLFGGIEATASVSQVTPLGFARSQISKGQARYSLAGFLGSFERFDGSSDPFQRDVAELSIEFFDEELASLEFVTVTGPASPRDVGLDTSVVADFSGFFEVEGIVPQRAVLAAVSIDLVRDPRAPSSFFNNANADLLDFRIRAVSEPPAAAGLLIASLSSAAVLCRRLRGFATLRRIACR